jgi:hypothetical protein
MMASYSYHQERVNLWDSGSFEVFVKQLLTTYLFNISVKVHVEFAYLSIICGNLPEFAFCDKSELNNVKIHVHREQHISFF